MCLKRFYWDAKEAILTTVLEHRGKEEDICIFEDSDHEGEKHFRSRCDFLIHGNTALVQK